MKSRFLKKLVLVFLLCASLLGVGACGETITVKFMVDGELYHQVTIEAGKTFNFPDNPVKEGYRFVGWKAEETSLPETDGSETEGGEISAVQNMVFHAVFELETVTYTVVFQDDEGNTIKEEKVEAGKDATPPEAPVKTGMTFAGWDASYTNIQGRTVIKAKYTLNSYRLRFISFGEDVSSEEVPYGTALEAKTADEIAGLVFGGWYDSADFGQKFEFTGAKMPAGDLTLYAKWEIGALVHADLTSEQNFTAIYGQTLTVSAVFDKVEAFTYAYRWFVDGEVLGGQTGDTATLSLGAGSPEIKCEITASGHGLTLVTELKKSAEIAKKDLTVTAQDASITYGDTLPELTMTFDGFVNGETASDIDLVKNASSSYDRTSESACGVNNYTVTPAEYDSVNYLFEYVNGTLEVTQKELVGTVQDKTIVYGDRLPSGTVVYDGFVEDFNDSTKLIGNIIFGSTNYSEGKNAGEYDFTVVTGQTNPNYRISYLVGKLTVEKKDLTLTVNASKNYDLNIWSESSWAEKVSGMLSGHTFTGTLANKDSALGRYEANGALGDSFEWLTAAAVKSGSEDVTKNYNFIYKLSVEITEGMIAAEATAENVVYDGKAHSLTVTVTFPADTQIQYSLDNENFTAQKPSFTTAGTYRVYYRITAEGFADKTGSAEIVIRKAKLTVTAGGAEIFYGKTAALPTLEYSGFVNGENDSVLDRKAFGIDTNYAVGKPVGKYLYSVKGFASDNYDIEYVSAELTVKPAPLTVTADNASAIYGSELPALTAKLSGLADCDDPAAELAKVKLICNYSAGNKFGTYDISAEYLNGNYSIEVVPGTLTVSQKTLGIVIAETKPFDGAKWSTSSVTSADLVSGHSIVGTVTTSGNFGVFEGKDSFVIDLRVLAGETDVTANYAFVYTLSVTIEKADFTADVSEAYSGAYDGKSHLPTVTAGSLATTPIITFTVNGTVLTEAELANSVLNIGTYQIHIKVTAEGYNDFEASQTVTISVREATVIAQDETLVYGSEAPAHTADIEGLADGADKAAFLAQVIFKTDYDGKVGTFYLKVSGVSDPNYIFRYMDATIKVNPAVLTVTADPKRITYLEDAPEYTAKITGFVNGEDAGVLVGTLVLTCDYTAGSNAGGYKIVPSGLTSGSYEIAFVSADLTVDKKPTEAKTHSAVTGLTYNKDRTLKEIPLDEHFYWVNEGTVPQAGTAEFDACYNPDPVNYLNSASFKISVTVEKAVVTIATSAQVQYKAGLVASDVKGAAADPAMSDAKILADLTNVDLTTGGTYRTFFTLDPTETNYTVSNDGIAGYLKIAAVMNKSTKVYYTLEDALTNVTESGSTLIVTANANFSPSDIALDCYGKKEFTVAAGVTLLLPFDGTYSTNPDSYLHKQPYVDSTKWFIKVSVPSGIQINVAGTMNVNALRTGYNPSFGNQANQGVVSGSSYAILETATNSSVKVVADGTLSCNGFITGSGEIVAESGAKVYDVMTVTGFRGGSITSGIYKKLFPFNQFSINNIEVPISIYSGAEYWARCRVTTSGGSGAGADVKMIGNDDKSFIQFKSQGFIRKTYDVASGVSKFSCTADLSLNNLQIKAKVFIGEITMDTAGKQMPMPWNFAIDIQSGNVEVNTGIKFLPGSGLTVGKDATLTVTDKGTIFAYGKDSAFTEGLYDTSYPNSTAMYVYRMLPDLGNRIKESANVTINGKLIVQSGGTVAGPVIAGENGRIEIDASAVLTKKILEQKEKSTLIEISGTFTGTIGGAANTPFELGKNYVYDGAGGWKVEEIVIPPVTEPEQPANGEPTESSVTTSAA